MRSHIKVMFCGIKYIPPLCRHVKDIICICVLKKNTLVVKCQAHSRLKIPKPKWLKALRNTGRPMKGHTPSFTLCAWATGVKVHCV